MPSIKIKDTDYFDIGLRKFKRACEKAGIVPEIRKENFTKNQLRCEREKWLQQSKEPIKLIENLVSQDKDRVVN